MDETEVAALLAYARTLTAEVARYTDGIERAARERSRVVLDLRSRGVPLATIERVTGASRAALLRHTEQENPR